MSSIIASDSMPTAVPTVVGMGDMKNNIIDSLSVLSNHINTMVGNIGDNDHRNVVELTENIEKIDAVFGSISAAMDELNSSRDNIKKAHKAAGDALLKLLEKCHIYEKKTAPVVKDTPPQTAAGVVKQAMAIEPPLVERDARDTRDTYDTYDVTKYVDMKTQNCTLQMPVFDYRVGFKIGYNEKAKTTMIMIHERRLNTGPIRFTPNSDAKYAKRCTNAENGCRFKNCGFYHDPVVCMNPSPYRCFNIKYVNQMIRKLEDPDNMLGSPYLGTFIEDLVQLGGGLIIKAIELMDMNERANE